MIDFTNIMRLRYVENIGEQSYLRVVLYNKTNITKRKVVSLIKNGKVQSSEYVVVISESQYDALFGHKE